jgi:hypothetical protein
MVAISPTFRPTPPQGMDAKILADWVLYQLVIVFELLVTNTC